MLFGEGVKRSFAPLYATHPPLVDRIKALNPSFDPREVAELQQRYAQQAPDGLAEDVAAGFAPPERLWAVGSPLRYLRPLRRARTQSALSRSSPAQARSPPPT